MTTKYQNEIMALLFASGEPVSAQKLAEAMGIDHGAITSLIGLIQEDLEDVGSPLQILRLSNQFQLSTRVEYTALIQKMMDEKRNKALSPASFEVLAAVAYNQPVTRGYIEQVRGVDSSGVVNALVEKGLLEEAGRLELPGRPIAYQTSSHFLRTFGLSELSELPTSSGDIEELLDDLQQTVQTDEYDENDSEIENQMSFEDGSKEP